MNFIRTSIPEVVLVEPKVFEDARGFFYEGYRKDSFSAHGITADFVQDNYIYSSNGTVRGLHYQIPPKAQGKLVHVTHGSIFDVAVDIRKGSPTFAQWVGYSLSAANRRFLYVPPGFAHGFCTLEPNTRVIYKVTDFYSPQHERGVRWDDPALGIPWPTLDVPYELSARDKNYPVLQEATLL